MSYKPQALGFFMPTLCLKEVPISTGMHHLKRSGAWWYPTNANNILKLRCAKYNETFDRIMAEVKRKNKNDLSQNKLGEFCLVVDNS